MIVGAISVGVDYLAHGSLIFTPIEFLKVNVLQEIGSFYGASPWLVLKTLNCFMYVTIKTINFRYWYLVVGLPITLGLLIFPFSLATVETLLNRSVFPQRFVLLSSIAFTLVIYSSLPHKEFRFILPILPMCLFITSDYLSRWSRKANR